MSSRTSGVHITGLREVVRDLERYGVEVEDLKAAFATISGQITQEAQGRINSVEGDLAGSVRPAKTKNKAVVRAGSAAVPYAGVINYGWSAHNIAPSEFLTGPANENPEDKVRTIERELEALIRRYNLT